MSSRWKWLLGKPFLEYKLRELKRHSRDLARPRELQKEALQRALQAVEDSALAQHHRLKPGMTLDDLRSRVPIGNYGRIEPFVERLRLGEHGALFSPRTPVIMLAQTSGTTGPAKYVPITRGMLENFRRTWTVWACGIARDHPRLPFTRTLNLASSWVAEHSPSGIPVGSVSGLLSSTMHGMLRLLNTVPPGVAFVTEPGLKTFLSLRLSLATDQLGVITTANPSTLIDFARKMDLWKEPLIRAIHDGDLGLWEEARGRLPTETARQLRWRLGRRPARAAKLEQLVKIQGRLAPKDAWPGLGVLGVWMGGTLAHYLRDLPGWYGDVALRDHGLSASEARMTVPLQDETSAGVLNLSGNVYEFVPEEEYGNENPRTLLPWELEEGESYYIILTTPGGFLRYDIADVVRCVRREGDLPFLEFLHKGAHIANLTGEKLTPYQVDQALIRVQNEFEISLGDSLLAPDPGPPARYLLLVEPHVRHLIQDGSLFLARLDKALRRGNVEYEDKRNSGRLTGPALETVPNGTWKSWRRRRLSSHGGSMEQYKHPVLLADLNWRNALSIPVHAPRRVP